MANIILTLQSRYSVDVIDFYIDIFKHKKFIYHNLPIVSISKNTVVMKKYNDGLRLDTLNLNDNCNLKEGKKLFSTLFVNMFESYWKKNAIHGDLNENNIVFNKEEKKLIIIDLFETMTFVKTKYRLFFLFLTEINELLRVYIKQCYGCYIDYFKYLKKKNDSFLIKTVKEITNYLNVMFSCCNNNFHYLLENKAKQFFKKYKFQFNLMIRKLKKIFIKEFKINANSAFDKKFEKL
jgi:serine/threonine-protein kinase RIO1